MDQFKGYTPVDDFLKELLDFKQHITDSTTTLLDELDETEEVDEKYDVVITINGKTIVVPSNADAYANIERLIYDELSDYKEV